MQLLNFRHSDVRCTVYELSDPPLDAPGVIVGLGVDETTGVGVEISDGFVVNLCAFVLYSIPFSVALIMYWYVVFGDNV